MEFISSQDSMDETYEINFETHQELKLIGVVDTYANASELTALFEDRDSLERMISFNQILNDQFEFYEIYNQPLQSKFYWNMDDSFLKCYDGVPIKNQEIEIDFLFRFISTISCSFLMQSRCPIGKISRITSPPLLIPLEDGNVTKYVCFKISFPFSHFSTI